MDELKGVTIQTTRDGNVFREPPASGAENLTLSGVPEGSRFDGAALRGVAQEVVRWFNSRGLHGVWVAYSDLESSAGGVVDNRPADNHVAHLVVWASQIAEVRTLARGKRIKSKDSINNPKHRQIIRRSPLHPGTSPDEPGSLFQQDVLNGYLHGLSLHPGRRVEASIASAGEPGKVVLDYLVNESKAWQLFSQVNNFGTIETGEIRARLGFQHNQLTNHDDILNIDAISTPDFATYGAFFSYRIPVFRPANLLARVYGSYGDFLASDTEIQNLKYVGNNWLAGTELANRHTLWRDWQLLSILGVNFNHYEIENKFLDSTFASGASDFLVPFIGTTLSRDTANWSISGSLRFDITVGSSADSEGENNIDSLGRLQADSEWTSARWNLNGTVFLDSLFQKTEKNLPQAHELAALMRGRVLLRGERLIPQEQEPLGGALSVRGYPESVLSADEFYAATIEYAYHIPRALKPAEPGTLFRRPFKWRPVQVGQVPDWDLSLRAFFDYAYRAVNPIEPSKDDPPVDPGAVVALADTNLSIAGAGVGITFAIKQNFSLRVDYGVALMEIRDPSLVGDEQVKVPKGNKEIHLVASFAW